MVRGEPSALPLGLEKMPEGFCPFILKLLVRVASYLRRRRAAPIFGVSGISSRKPVD